MKNERTKKIIESVCNSLALLLGLAFLGDVFDLWSFDPFNGWWVLFLYIPAISGFITNGITPGGVMLSLTAVIQTIGMFADIDGRIWSVALILYLAYLGGRSILKNLKTSDDDNSKTKGGSNDVQHS